MMDDLKLQALRFGTEIKYLTILNVDLTQTPYKLTDENNNIWATETIIISTGAEAKLLGIPSEQKYWGSGVSACATCDGFFFRNKHVVVVGGGDTACEESLYLSNICDSVTILVRSDKMKASLIMQERVKSKQNILIEFNTEILEIMGNKKVEMLLTNKSVMSCDGLFIAIGHKPNTDLFKDSLVLDQSGYIITKNNSTHTNVEGVFACGDVQDSVYRQAVTAAGTGCMAALDCERFLTNKS